MAQISILRKLPREIREMIYGFALDVDPGNPPVLLVDEMLCSLAKLQPSERAFIPDRVIYREIFSFNIEHSVVRLEMIRNRRSGSGFDVDHDCPSLGTIDLVDARFEMKDSGISDSDSDSDYDCVSFGVIPPLVWAALRNVQIDIPGYPVLGDKWFLRELGKDYLIEVAKATEPVGLMLMFQAIFKSLSKAPTLKSICFFFLKSMVTCASGPRLPMYLSIGEWGYVFLNINWEHLAECLASFPQLGSFGFRGTVKNLEFLLEHKTGGPVDNEGTSADTSEICPVCLIACEEWRIFDECFLERPKLQCNPEYFSIVWRVSEGMRLLNTEDGR